MTEAEFVTAICTRLQQGLAANEALLGYIPTVRYPNRTVQEQPAEQLRIRMEWKNTVTKQTTLGSPPRYTTTGVFYAQIYAPAGTPESARQLADLADLVQSFYLGVSEPNGIWYRDVSKVHQPPTSEAFSVRVGGKYSYERYGLTD